MIDIRHLKLVSGQEIITDVVEWDSPDEAGLVIRNAFELHYLYNPDTHMRVCTMRPFMMGQIEEGLFQSLNADLILAMANPTMEVIDSYKETLREYLKPLDEVESYDPLDPTLEEELDFDDFEVDKKIVH